MIKRPIIFRPIYKNVIWGGTRIAQLKGVDIDSDCVGESWEISSVADNESVVAEGEYKDMSISQLIDEFGDDLLGHNAAAACDGKFPLLIKFIDARRDLSLQVHPTEELARQRHNSHGKTEMWYVVDSQPGSKILAGLNAPLTPDVYLQRISDNTILEVVRSYDSVPHQFYYIPAGLIHAIGAGNLILEIQQTSDITYRVYDYDRRDAAGNPRELHTHLAKDAIDYSFPNPVEPTAKEVDSTTIDVVKSPYFRTHLLKLSEGAAFHPDASGRSFTILIVTDGEVSVTLDDGSVYRYTRGQTALLPACLGKCVITGDATALAVENANDTQL